MLTKLAAALAAVAAAAVVVAAPKPPPGPGTIVFQRAGVLTRIDPDGANEKPLFPDGTGPGAIDLRLSPDGKRIAVTVPAGRVGPGAPGRVLRVAAVGGKDPAADLGVPARTFAWSPDGTELAASDFDGAPGGAADATHAVVTVATKATAALRLPDGHTLLDWSPDGKQFLTRRDYRHLHLVNRDGTGDKAVTGPKGSFADGRLSPDGKQVLALKSTPGKKLWLVKPVLVEVATGKESPPAGVAADSSAEGCCWSPDGKRIAFTWRKVDAGPDAPPDRETEAFLVVCDPDGKNAKTIASAKGKGQFTVILGGIDWR